jgi:hypothetical protein
MKEFQDYLPFTLFPNQAYAEGSTVVLTANPQVPFRGLSFVSTIRPGEVPDFPEKSFHVASVAVGVQEQLGRWRPIDFAPYTLRNLLDAHNVKMDVAMPGMSVRVVLRCVEPFEVATVERSFYLLSDGER